MNPILVMYNNISINHDVDFNHVSYEYDDQL